MGNRYNLVLSEVQTNAPVLQKLRRRHNENHEHFFADESHKPPQGNHEVQKVKGISGPLITHRVQGQQKLHQKNRQMCHLP